MDVKSHVLARPGILANIQQSMMFRTASKMVQMFGTLLSQWSTISFDARVIIETLPENSTLSDDELYNITHEYFGKYLANGLSLLANLPDSWEKTFGGISTLCSIGRVSLMSSF